MKMNGHIFVYHEATTVPTQYIDTMERLGSYASDTFKYINLMVQTLDDTSILKPESLKKKHLMTHTSEFGKSK